MKLSKCKILVVFQCPGSTDQFEGKGKKGGGRTYLFILKLKMHCVEHSRTAFCSDE